MYLLLTLGNTQHNHTISAGKPGGARATLPATSPVGQCSNFNPDWATHLGLGFRTYSRQSRQWISSLVELHVLRKVSRCPCIAPQRFSVVDGHYIQKGAMYGPNRMNKATVSCFRWITIYDLTRLMYFHYALFLNKTTCTWLLFYFQNGP